MATPLIPKYYIDKAMAYNIYETSIIKRARRDDGNNGCLFCSRGENKVNHKKICGANNTVQTGTAKVINKKIFTCTRRPNHPGYHVACDTAKGKHAILIWK